MAPAAVPSRVATSNGVLICQHWKADDLLSGVFTMAVAVRCLFWLRPGAARMLEKRERKERSVKAPILYRMFLGVCSTALYTSGLRKGSKWPEYAARRYLSLNPPFPKP